MFFRGEEDQQTLRTCDSLTSSSSFRRTQRGKKNEEKHNNNNGSIVFDDVNDDVNKVVFEDVPLPRRALSSSHTFSFVFVQLRAIGRYRAPYANCIAAPTVIQASTVLVSLQTTDLLSTQTTDQLSLQKSALWIVWTTYPLSVQKRACCMHSQKMFCLH